MLRTDIQGLRAVCILSVVFYHAQLPGFSGGFVGVDAFFVVSGFLIVGMLLDEVNRTGRVDLVGFWGRRARRLLPNATVVLIATLALGAVLVPPHAWEILAAEVAFASVYLANYRFASKAVDYFHFDDPLSPALHYWSLSIEEQFYIVWPVLLLAACWHPRFRRSAPAILLGLIWALSFAYCMSVATNNQPLALFHTETRCWQLATGGLAAVLIRRVGPLPSPLGWIGLAALVVAVVGLNDRMAYPSTLALLPTMGTASILLTAPSHRGSVVTVLGRSPLQWIGARSYSWYLWHWPALVYAGMIWPGQQSAVLLSVPLSLALAHVVFKHVEDPIRRGAVLPSPRRSLAAGSVAIAAVLACSAAFARMPNMTGGTTAELSEALKRSSSDRGQNYADACHLGYETAPHRECAYGTAASPRRVVLFGDSHAAQWFPAVNAAATAAGWQFNAWTKTSCPAADVTIWYAPRRAPYTECDHWRREIMDRLTGLNRPDLVFIASLTTYDVIGGLQDRRTGVPMLRDDARQAWQDGLRSTLERLASAGVPVVIVRDTPKAFRSFAACLAQGGGTACDRPRSQALEPVPSEVVVAREFAGRGVTVLDLTERICGRAVCPAMRDKMIVYADHHHVTAAFATTLSAEFGKALDRRSALRHELGVSPP